MSFSVTPGEHYGYRKSRILEYNVFRLVVSS